MVALHFGLVCFHKAQNVISAVFDLVICQWRPWKTQLLIVKYVTVQLLVLHMHLLCVHTQRHVAVDVTTPEFQLSLIHGKFGNLARGNGEYFTGLEIIDLLQEYKFI